MLGSVTVVSIKQQDIMQILFMGPTVLKHYVTFPSHNKITELV